MAVSTSIRLTITSGSGQSRESASRYQHLVTGPTASRTSAEPGDRRTGSSDRLPCCGDHRAYPTGDFVRVRDGAQFDRLERHLDAFVDQPLTVEDYVTAAKFYNLCRAKGIQGANTDFLICAVAVRHDFSIFTTDQDFLHFAKCLPIVLHDARLTRSAPAHYRRSDPKREA